MRAACHHDKANFFGKLVYLFKFELQCCNFNKKQAFMAARKKKSLTRREVKTWFLPIRSAVLELRSGETDCVDNKPVSKMGGDGDYSRIDFMINAWCRCFSRVIPGADLAALELVQNRLTNDELLTVQEIDAALASLNRVEDMAVKIPLEQIKSAVLTEQIAVELEIQQREDSN